MIAAGVIAVCPGLVYGQPASTGSGPAFPVKAIRLVTSQPGGGADFVARLIAQGTAPALGQPVVVDNRATGVIPGQLVARAQPDGYTLLVFGGTFWLQPLLQKNVPYDPVKDFAPITLAHSSPTVLVVHPSLPVKNVKEIIALAKSKPGMLNYSSGGAGSSAQLATELFKSMTGVNMVQINYKGTGPAVNGLLSGEAQLMFSNAAASAPHIKSGRMKALAVASLQPSELFPGLPTIAASGAPGFTSGSTIGVFAPAGTPAAIINRLHQEIVRVLRTDDVKKKFFDSGAETVGSTPQELGDFMKAEIARMGKVIRDAGISEP